MSLFNTFLNDDSGMILSAEAVLVGTVGIIGATVGLSAAAKAIDAELTETALAIRSLDQSYSFQGQSCGTAWTAGSRFVQEPAFQSRAELLREVKRDRRDLERATRDGREPNDAPRRQRRGHRRHQEHLRERADGQERQPESLPPSA